VSITDASSCSFPISINLQVTLVGRVFYDAQGNFQSVTIQQDTLGTDSANGISLREDDHWVDFIDSLGADKEVGVPIHVQGASGLVIRDAGLIQFNPDGSVVYLRGPHPSLEGENAAVCAALTP